jgi:hypothetical protein
MALTLVAGSLLLFALVLMIEGTHFGIWATGRFELNPSALATWRYRRWGIAIASAMFAVELLYHFGPDLKQRFRDSLPGAIIAVMSWIGLSYLLGSYFRHFDSLRQYVWTAGCGDWFVYLVLPFRPYGTVGWRGQCFALPITNPKELTIVLRRRSERRNSDQQSKRRSIKHFVLLSTRTAHL